MNGKQDFTHQSSKLGEFPTSPLLPTAVCLAGLACRLARVSGLLYSIFLVQMYCVCALE